MASIKVLGARIPVEFKIGKEAVLPMDQAAILKGAGEMAALINSKTWPPAFAAAFKGMKKIVFFEGKVKVNGHLVDRPGVDEDDAIFYWEASEFNNNTDADVRANTFFHDCWHVVQFKAAGKKFAKGEKERVAREVDALNQQIAVARILGNDAREIKFIEDFRDDQDRIKARLDEGVAGVGGAVAPHKPGAMRPGG
jgi:hypothetical protein